MKRFQVVFACVAVTTALSAVAAIPMDLSKMTEDQIVAARPTSLELAAADRIYNPEAPVPPQCYTRIEGRYNPCYVCHQNNQDRTRPNFMQDGSLQSAYEFSETGLTNHYRNLFIDRSGQVAEIPDQEILAYIGEDNYSGLAERLNAQGWKGWVPDLKDYEKGTAAFDEYGFARDGSNWVAFNYKPQPSTFWPTNGSTDDVIIRLPEAFRTTTDGAPSRDVYMANLALLEMAFQDLDSITTPEIDEARIGIDLNGDGQIAKVAEIKRHNSYLGAASKITLQRMLYPEGTEFMHSVRYVGVDENGEIVIPPRMKELRHMVKTRALTIPQLHSRYGNEHQEKIEESLPHYIDLGGRGMDTGFGWTLTGFIEDANGELRPQTNEEQFFCRGCHATTGASIDQTWAFPRKLTGAGGWGYIDYRALPDAPSKGETEGEILTYFKRAGGGDEFRSNTEMPKRWFSGKDQVNEPAVKGKSVYELITPSRNRAPALNKAYRVLVKEQSFIFGRDATIKPPHNVHAKIDEANAPTLPEDKRYTHDIRLDW